MVLSRLKAPAVKGSLFSIVRAIHTKVPVIVTRRLPEDILEKLNPSCSVHLWNNEEAIPRSTFLEWVSSIKPSGILCMLTDKVDKNVLDSCGPALKVISSMSVGVDHIDLAECKQRGVIVGNTPGVLTDATADLAVALLLATARRLPEAAAAVKNGQWATWKPFWLTSSVEVAGSTVGIVGLGRIGAAFAQRMRGFGCRLLYCGNRPHPDIATPLGAEYVTFHELLRQSDFVSLHCPLTSQTRGLMNSSALSQMKQTAILINTSRGGVVDQEALYDALTSGMIGGAGLDVTDPEPLPPSHKLLTLPNVLVLPHIGSASVPTRRKMAEIAVENLLRGVCGQSLLYAVV